MKCSLFTIVRIISLHGQSAHMHRHCIHVVALTLSNAGEDWNCLHTIVLEHESTSNLAGTGKAKCLLSQSTSTSTECFVTSFSQCLHNTMPIMLNSYMHVHEANILRMHIPSNYSYSGRCGMKCGEGIISTHFPKYQQPKC